MHGIKPHTGPSAATAMRHVLKENMKDHVLNVREHPKYIRSLLRITAYKDHNKLIKDEFKQRIQILDEKYGSYTMWMDIVQMSIIILAASSSFLQAGNDIINLDKAVISFISLIISSYTGLVLALAKYKKIDEKKETINNLRHQCADFLTQIQTRTDKLNTWCYDRMWAGGNIEKMASIWEAEDEQLYNELKPLIEKKQALTCEFERILDSLTVKKTSKLVRARDLKFKKQSIEFTELEDNLEDKENELESERKKKLQRAFYNTDYTQKRVNKENNNSMNEKDEIISTLQDQLEYTSKQIGEIEEEHKAEKKKLIRKLKNMQQGIISRSPDKRRGRSKTRTQRRPRRRSPSTEEEVSGSGYSSSSSIDSAINISLESQKEASRLRKILIKAASKLSSFGEVFDIFTDGKDFFTFEDFDNRLLDFDNSFKRKHTKEIFKMIDTVHNGKVFIRQLRQFTYKNNKGDSLSTKEYFLEGDIVEAKYKNKGRFFKGKILCKSHPPGTYKIEFDDGDICADILPENIRLIKRVNKNVNTHYESKLKNDNIFDPTIPNRPFFREKNDSDSERSLPQDFAIDMPNEKKLDENSSLTLQKAVFRFQKILRQGVPKIGSITDIFNYFSNRKRHITAEDFEINLLDFDSNFKKSEANYIFKIIDDLKHGKVTENDFLKFRDKNRTHPFFLEGDIVEAQYNNRGLFLKGKILDKSNPPGIAYRVKFDRGGFEGDDILPSCIRLLKRGYAEDDNINLIIDDPTIPDRVILSKRREDFRWNMYKKQISKGIDGWKNFVRQSKIESMLKRRAFRKLKKLLDKKNNDIAYDSSGNRIKGDDNV